jgi:hypothetical protein
MNKELEDFLNDKELMSKYKPTPEEIELLKKGTFTVKTKITKQFYEKMLLDYRKIAKR